MLKRAILLCVATAVACSPSLGQVSGHSDGEVPGLLPPSLAAEDDPWSEGLVGTALLLRRLDGAKRVLMIGAHPDDEDTALLAGLARGMGVETAYLSLSRGEGGQNLIGPEMEEGLGLVRTGELLAARALDGGRQFFTRAFDFGYSKTAEETFRYWPREEILRDVTWVVRTFRPQIIVSVFSGTPRDGHGHHHVAGIVAHEVFSVAGDPARFPEQIEEGLPAWTPSKLYRLTRRNPQEGTTGIETGTFDPLLGRSYFQVAMDSRSQHRSQDMGVSQPMGPRRSRVALVESVVDVAGPDEMFAGVDTALVALARRLPGGIRGSVEGQLRDYRSAIAEAGAALDVTDPFGSSEPLAAALEALNGALADLSGSGGEADELRRTLLERRPLVQKALLRASGVVVDVRISADLLVPGQDVDGVVEIWNGGPHTLSGVHAAIQGPASWGQSGPIGSLGTIESGTVGRWPFRISVPDDGSFSKAFYMRDDRDAGLYRWPAATDDWAAPANRPLLAGEIRFDLADLGPVTSSAPGRFRGVDKATGEFVKPVQVVPALSVAMDPPTVAWPSASTAPREFTVTVQSQAAGEWNGSVSLTVPDGWGLAPARQPVSLSEPGASAAFTFQVERPADVAEGLYRLEARVTMDDGQAFSEGVTLVDYPHIRRGALFRPAETRVSVFPVLAREGLRVAYVMGSGDGGPEAIRHMGVPVDLLGPDALQAGDFEDYDAVILGIRAYETRSDVVAANDALLDYARSGGTLIVQYNKYEFPRGGFAPYPVNMSRPHDRVSDETAPVRILDPSHDLFRSPNRITRADFEGWVQERGLYFLSEWGPEYTPLLEMRDPGEAPKQGGLMVAPLGSGFYVYTGLSFFRQFPHGVPGAYRLFANLISLKADHGGRP
jgi:LmbE family N-acetylglucosaminyl deacetylase